MIQIKVEKNSEEHCQVLWVRYKHKHYKLLTDIKRRDDLFLITHHAYNDNVKLRSEGIVRPLMVWPTNEAFVKFLQQDIKEGALMKKINKKIMLPLFTT
jgi:hypothetical protein